MKKKYASIQDLKELAKALKKSIKLHKRQYDFINLFRQSFL